MKKVLLSAIFFIFAASATFAQSAAVALGPSYENRMKTVEAVNLREGAQLSYQDYGAGTILSDIPTSTSIRKGAALATVLMKCIVEGNASAMNLRSDELNVIPTTDGIIIISYSKLLSEWILTWGRGRIYTKNGARTFTAN